MRRSDRRTGKKRPNSLDSAAARSQLAVATADPATTVATAADSTASTGDVSTPGADSQATAPQRGFRFVDRRKLLRLAGTGAAAVPASGLLAACGGSSSSKKVRPIRIGIVTPQSGDLSSWSDSDLYITDVMKSYFATNPLVVGSTTHPVEIYVRDSQSTYARAGKAATQLIYDDGADVVLVGSTSDTVVPVADQCEAMGVPCISTMAPWESFFYTRGGTLDKPFTWTYHFFAGLAEYYTAYSSMWNQSEVTHNNTVGLLLPDDIDGHQFGDPMKPFRQNVAAHFDLVDPVYYPPGGTFTDIIGKFQSRNAQIIAGVMSTADFLQFQHDSNDFSPQIATLSKAAMFPLDVQQFATSDRWVTTEMFWSDKHPYRGFLTNKPASQLAADFAVKTGPGWSQQLGTSMALFDVAAAAIQKVDSIDDKASIAAALKTLTVNTMVGKVTFGGGNKNVPANVAVLKLNGGQWTWDSKSFLSKLLLVNDAGDPSIGLQGTLVALPDPTA